MADIEPNKKEGLEALDAAQVEELHDMVAETSAPPEDPVTGAPEDGDDEGRDERARKAAERNEKDLLFESADTWQHMEVPE